MTCEQMLAAMADYRVIVKVGRSWWAAREPRPVRFTDGTWLIRVVAGPHSARGYITNIDNNSGGRDFAILQQGSVR